MIHAGVPSSLGLGLRDNEPFGFILLQDSTVFANSGLELLLVGTGRSTGQAPVSSFQYHVELYLRYLIP